MNLPEFAQMPKAIAIDLDDDDRVAVVLEKMLEIC
jgi:hypothetical protein